MIDALKERLKKGLYINNLYEMATLCRRQAMDTSVPLPFWVLDRIFLDIAYAWEDRPLPVEEAERLQKRILAPIRDVMTAIEKRASPAELYRLLNTLLVAYLVHAN